LVKYHVEGNDESFINEVRKIAEKLNCHEEQETGEVLLDLISDNQKSAPAHFLEEIAHFPYDVYFSSGVKEGFSRIHYGLFEKDATHRILFYGPQGTYKKETVMMSASLLGRQLVKVNTKALLSASPDLEKDYMIRFFKELEHLQPEHVIVLLPHLDTLLAQIDDAAYFLKELQWTSPGLLIIATAETDDLTKYFQVAVNFDCLSKEDLCEIGDSNLRDHVDQASGVKLDTRFLKKIITTCDRKVYPGELRKTIKKSMAYHDHPYDYLCYIYNAL